MGASRTKSRIPGSISADTSAELFRRARAGESDALGKLLARYLPKLMRLAHRRVPAWARNGADTADLVQDTFLHTLRNIGSFEPNREDALLRYLRRGLLNQVRDRFRHAARHPPPAGLNEALADSGASPLDLTIDAENRRRYRMALTTLRPADRDAIVGRIELGYTYDQLALMLGKPTPEAARLAVRRALVRLGEEMRRV